jgi:hypothetical protein
MRAIIMFDKLRLSWNGCSFMWPLGTKHGWAKKITNISRLKIHCGGLTVEKKIVLRVWVMASGGRD